MSTLNVYWDTEFVGRLAKTGGQEMSFQYSANYLASQNPQPISLLFPLQAEVFAGPLPTAWFANLLPEGEIRGHVAHKLGVSDRNEYALLKGIGGDCAWQVPRINSLFTSPRANWLCPVATLQAHIC